MSFLLTTSIIMSLKSLANYRRSLDDFSRRRYDDKIALINGQDPYLVEKSAWSQDDVSKWAGVTYPDIVNFLLYSTSAYTLDELKSFKGLEAYNQFVNGWVRDVCVLQINGYCLHTGKVLHSQRLSDPPLAPWLIIQNDGRVISAHCNCMAGLGEACTHIASVLFSIEAAVKMRESKTVTEDKAYWLPTSLKSVQNSSLQEIDFTSAKTMKKNYDAQLAGTPFAKRNSCSPTPDYRASNQLFSNFLLQLSQAEEQSSVLAVKAPYNQAFIPKSASNIFPKLLTDLKNNDLCYAPFPELMDAVNKVEVKVTLEESDNVEMATKKQSETKLWNRFRSGRITASQMYAACHTKLDSPSLSLLRTICNPESTNFTSTATSWGLEHENTGRQCYVQGMQPVHDNFLVEDAGFRINPDYPVFGASPDGLVSCDCCGFGVLEVKCPFSMRFDDLKAVSGKNSFLEEIEGNQRLKRTHKYYYQVQTQLYVCSADYCDFVVWTEKGMFMERITPDPVLWQSICEKANKLHKHAVMPELMARHFSQKKRTPLIDRSQVSTAQREKITLYCYCRKPESKRAMVACDNENCFFQWFHFSCLKIQKSSLPEGNWYCPECRDDNAQLNKRKKSV